MTGLEAHVGDALAFMAREPRTFDVVFLDPPFAEDPWATLFDMLPCRLAADGRVYAEAGRKLVPPAGWETLRHAKAGHVHYHLLAPTPPAAKS